MELVFASGNNHKLKEVSEILGTGFKILSLGDIGCHEEIPEPWPSLEENALAKARFVFQGFGLNCFADDSGLEVSVLGGKPGVESACYAGLEKNSHLNMQKLLKELENETNRYARFRAVIALILNGREHLFEGIVNGTIAYAPKGNKGFGYDPVFVPEGYSSSFGELPFDVKNNLSHRYRAIEEMRNFLLKP